MSQALIISDNEVLNDLYKANLEVYVGTNVTVKRTTEEAVELLKLNPDFDVVICTAKLKGKDISVEILEELTKVGSKTPLLTIGKVDKLPEGVKNIQSSYNLKEVVKEVASILNITAKDMAEKEVPEYFPINLNLLTYMKEVPCTVYYQVRLSETEFEYHQILPPETELEKVVEKYTKEGVSNLFVPALDRLKFINNASDGLVQILKDTKNLSSGQKLEITENVQEILVESLFGDEVVSREIADISTQCIETISDVITEAPSLKKLLMGMLEAKSSYMYRHGVIATYVAGHIIRNISWGGEGQLEKVNFIMFFHDMHLAPLYKKYPDLEFEEDIIYNDQITDKEREFMIHHARLAGEAISNFPRCPIGADTIIKQHHGMTNGIGFAPEFKDDISPLAKVIVISEAYTETFLKLIKSGEKLEKPNQMIIEKLYEKFTRNTYKKIIKTLENFRI